MLLATPAVHIRANLREQDLSGRDVQPIHRGQVDPGQLEQLAAHIEVAEAGYEMPPNGQGIAALAALGMLRHFDLASFPVDSADSWHLQIEAMKLALADTWRNVTDPAAMQVTPISPLSGGH